MIGALSVTAGAQAVTVRDDAGRSIVFDVRATGADVAGYASILRRAVHGPEIQGLTVRVVSPSRVAATCRDARATGCYSRGRGGAVITIPARSASRVQATLLHEYGHHVDATVRTPRWWSARRMAWRLRTGQVVMDYSKGWSRSAGEVFAEDYVALHVRGMSAIRWLPVPSAAVLRALRRDITGRSGGLPPSAPDPATDPAVPVGGSAVSRTLRTGVVGRGNVLEAIASIGGSGRFVTATVRPDPALGEVPTTVDFTCDGMTPAVYAALPGETTHMTAGPLGTGACTVRVTGPADATGGVTVEMVVATTATGG